MIRGKVDGLIYQQWHGMQIRRSRKLPTNPRTAAQLAVRGILLDSVNQTKIVMADSARKDQWAHWAALNPFPSTKRYHNVTLPAYNAALKVQVALNNFDLYNAGDVPTTNPNSLYDTDIAVEAIDNTLSVSWPDVVPPLDAADVLQLWVCTPTTASGTYKPQQAKLVYIHTIGNTSHGDEVFFTQPLDFGQEQIACVWGRVMKPTDAIPGTWHFFGQFTLVGA